MFSIVRKMDLYWILFLLLLSQEAIEARSLTDENGSEYKVKGKSIDLNNLRKEFLEKNGFEQGEQESIDKRVRELRELRNKLPDSEKVWLDNLMPNLRDADDVFDGCSWMTSRQIDYVMNLVTYKLSNESTAVNKSDFERERKTRKVERFSIVPVRKWRNPIFYKFDGSHNKEERGNIRSALRHWQAQTCLRFFEFSSNSFIFFDHLIFSASLYGCLSFVGKANSKNQLINLHGVCLTKFGTPVHEIGHTLGLYHEHQRWDRDKYIRIVASNIVTHKTQFWRQATDTFDLPYDYGSVMHYGTKDGSTGGGRNTIETIDPLFQQSIGQRTGLSFYDARSINIAYCKMSCRKPLPKPCERGGYQDPNACTRCRCPDGFGGLFCETVAPPVGVVPCGGIVSATESGTIITSPGYHFPGFYDDRTECNWLVKAPVNHKLILTFLDDFGIYCHNRYVCYHWVEVRYKGDLSHPGPRVCCFNRPKLVLESDGRELLVLLRTNYTTYWPLARRGFKVKIIADKMSDKEMGEISKKLEVSTKTDNVILPGTSWGKWGRCQNSECKCGGCSVSTRHSMCGKEKCVGNYARSESMSCDRICTKKDTYLNLSGNIIEMPCPRCCKVFRPKGDKCVSDI